VGLDSFLTKLIAKFGVNLDLQAKASAAYERVIKKTSSTTVVISPTMYPIEYRGPGENSTTKVFLAGVALACNNNLRLKTLIVSDPELPEAEGVHYLHKEFHRIGDNGTWPPDLSKEDQTEPNLKEIVGGSPFDHNSGAYNPKCYSQALQFEKLAKEAMEPIQVAYVDASVALQSSRLSSNLNKLFADSDCPRASSPSQAKATATTQ
jgi:hypothetical protein